MTVTVTVAGCGFVQYASLVGISPVFGVSRATNCANVRVGSIRKAFLIRGLFVSACRSLPSFSRQLHTASLVTAGKVL
jgi:hypothetical protein